MKFNRRGVMLGLARAVADGDKVAQAVTASPSRRTVTASRRTLLVAATGAAAGTALAACGATAQTAQWNPAGGPGGSGGASPDPVEAGITVIPAAGATGVSPAGPVVVTASAGTLQSVTLAAGGKPVEGALDTDQKTWRSSGKLSYGATYTVTATLAGAGAGATPATKTTTFTTVKPSKQVTAILQASIEAALKSGATYGVGQPICVSFSSAPADKDAAVKAIDVQVDPPVEIRWHWIDSTNVHARPEKFWAPGTKITVNLNLFGVDLGKGKWGKSNASGHFTIGPEQRAVADSNTHYMKVYVNGQQVKNMPCSMGKPGTATGADGQIINFTTDSGIHVILTREYVHHMTSASIGLVGPDSYDEDEYYACRISYSGEFVHANPLTVYAQGHSNVSHGCINLSTDNAKWIYNNFRLGDIVEVVNTSRQFALSNGLGDWNTPWDKW